MAYSPRLLGQPAKPSQIGEKLAKTWDILSPYVTGPVDAWKGLMEADLNTLLYDKGAGGRKAVEDAFNVAGTVTGGSSVVPKPSNALNMGIKAYHASPYSFDKFEWSPKTRGTGEGAQAYGDGLYFAEAEGTAQTYRDALKNKALIDPNADMLDPKRIAGELYDSWQGDIQGALSDAGSYDNSRAIIAELKKIGANPPKGHMYEVNIDADPNAFLDWDKPLSEQSEAVQGFANALKDQSFLARKRLEDISSATGKDVWEKARNAFGVGNVDAATKAFNQAGIPGIKYLDAGSRGKGVAYVQPMYKGQPYGDPVPAHAWNQVDQLTQRYKDMGYDVEVQDLGTRNYVVFDDKLISIVRKYGIAGASAMLGYNVLEGMDKAQADTLNKADLDYRADEFYRQGGV